MDTTPIANAIITKAHSAGQMIQIIEIVPNEDEIMGPTGFRATYLLDGVEKNIHWRIFDIYMSEFARLIPDERARNIEWIAADVENIAL